MWYRDVPNRFANVRFLSIPGDAMEHARRKFLHLAAGAAALPAISRLARAESYPSRPVPGSSDSRPPAETTLPPA